MKFYIGSKIIKAEPMTEYHFILGKFISTSTMYDLPKLNRDGYIVHYPDGYVSWSPKDVFEIAYREITENEKKLIS